MGRPIRHRDKWRIRWFDEHGLRKSEVYDTHKDAEFALRRHENLVEEVQRGFRSLRHTDKCFDELCDYHLTNRSVLKRRMRDDESIIRVHLKPFFGNCRLSQVSEKVDAFKASRSLSHPVSANHQLTLLITMLRVAHEKKWLLEMPVIKKFKVRLFDKDFHYLKTEEEIRRFLEAAKVEGRRVFATVAFSLYTGVRPGELLSLKKDHVLLHRRLVVIEKSHDGTTKNGEVRYVLILDPLLPILKDWLVVCEGPLLFPNEAGTQLGERARLFSEILHRILDRANFPKIKRNGKVSHYIHYYDLRHTFASHWMQNKGNLFKLSKVLGHKNIQMTMRYAHMEPDAFAEDYGRMGKSLAPPNVTSLRLVSSSVDK
jgi:integrase